MNIKTIIKKAIEDNIQVNGTEDKIKKIHLLRRVCLHSLFLKVLIFEKKKFNIIFIITSNYFLKKV